MPIIAHTATQDKRKISRQQRLERKIIDNQNIERNHRKAEIGMYVRRSRYSNIPQ